MKDLFLQVRSKQNLNQTSVPQNTIQTLSHPQLIFNSSSYNQIIDCYHQNVNQLLSNHHQTIKQSQTSLSQKKNQDRVQRIQRSEKINQEEIPSRADLQILEPIYSTDLCLHRNTPCPLHLLHLSHRRLSVPSPPHLLPTPTPPPSPPSLLNLQTWSRCVLPERLNQRQLPLQHLLHLLHLTHLQQTYLQYM